MLCRPMVYGLLSAYFAISINQHDDIYILALEYMGSTRYALSAELVMGNIA